MSYNGSGVFNINTTGQPVVTGTVISSSTFNALTADLATGLSTAITKDGQTTVTANIPLNSYKITGLAAGTAATDAARLGQVQAGTAALVTVTGTDTYLGTMSPVLTAYAAGNVFTFVVPNTNTSSCTINIDSLGAKAITRDGSTALVAGDLVANSVVTVVYDGTRFQVLNSNSKTNLNLSGNFAVAGSVTASGGTANGVAYLNASKVLTTGSALTFDGTNLGLGVTPSAWGASWKAFQMGGNPAISGSNVALLGNAYNNGTNWIYTTSNYASRYDSNFNGGGAHAWFTAPSGTAGNTITFVQAMTLDASGNLLVGTTDNTGVNTAGFEMYLGSGGSRMYIGHVSGTANGTQYVVFNYNGTSQIGSISQSGTTAVLYNTTSDRRLKTNIEDADSASSLIDAIQVRQFDWLSDDSHQRYGMIAQELYEVAPEAVHKPVDDADMMAVDYSKLVPMLVKEIQELRARVSQLENK